MFLTLGFPLFLGVISGFSFDVVVCWLELGGVLGCMMDHSHISHSEGDCRTLMFVIVVFFSCKQTSGLL
jgi:hypothetical protein